MDKLFCYYKSSGISSRKILLAKTLSQYCILHQGLQCIFDLKSGHVEILPRSIVIFSSDI